MKKFLLALLSVLCLACFTAAIACAPSAPDYYILTFDAMDGVTFDFGGITTGAQVKEGYTVRFTVGVDENAVLGKPAIMVNGDEQYPDREGVYSFDMKEDTYVTVKGVYAMTSHSVKFDKKYNGEEWRVKYLDLDGNELTEFNANFDDEIKFKLDISVYYDVNSDYSVLANTTILKPDDDGVYSFTVSKNTVVSLRGLELEQNMFEKENGTGTANDPYIIERPIDLYAMAQFINDPFNASGTYQLAHYKLANDIDMKGEQLFVIGDATSSNAVFMGEFDGAGHTIKNYYISDRIIEQEGYTSVFISFLGLFGQAVATAYGPVSIHDVTLDNFKIDIDASTAMAGFYAGGVVGISIGAQIENCKTLNGVITADADDNYFGYMGGVAGCIRSAYSATLVYNTYIANSYSNVELLGNTGYIRAGGGIVGFLESADEYANAYVINSHYDGEVSGAQQAGGIAGEMGPYSSVKNCYAVGDVEAQNDIEPTGGYASYAHAYAGGIAGYVGYESSISNCLAAVAVHAYADGGFAYSHSGDICGGISDGSEYIEANAGAVVNCTYDENDLNKAYLTGTLGWSEDDWSFDGAYPAVKKNDKVKSVSVTIVADGSARQPVALNGRKTIYEWYGNGLDRFVTSGNLRSFGYYFDKELTKKVPDAYVLTGNERLYCGLADYNEVSGKFYLQTENTGSGIYIEIFPDGSILYKEGARNVKTRYIYDGTTLTIYDCPVFTEYDESYVTDANGNRIPDGNGGYVTTSTPYYSGGKATLEGGRLILINDITYTAAAPRVAVKELAGFAYGDYYSGADNYSFYADGTGRINNRIITYTIDGARINISDNGTARTGVVANGEVVSVGNANLTKYDPFKGVWEREAAFNTVYTFDGRGGWSYKRYTYIKGERIEITESCADGEYAYNAENNVLELDNGVTVSFDEDGFIKATGADRSESYYGELSYKGTWRYFYKNEAIEITFGGIGEDGTGDAVIDYETLPGNIDAKYHVAYNEEDDTEYVYIYDGDELLGMLYFEPEDLTLHGMIYSYRDEEIIYSVADGNTTYYPVRFCLYDEMYGEWLSEELGAVSFDGFGTYDMNGLVIGNTTINTAVFGSVTIGKDRVQYKLDEEFMSGSFTYKSVVYNVSYDEIADVINVTANGNKYAFVRPDDMYGLKLAAGNTVYTFDGGSRHAAGGNVTDGTNSYKYKIDGETIKLLSEGEQVGTITVVGGNYVLSLGGGTQTLVIENGFTGSWLIGRSLHTLEIGEISASLTATGSYRGAAVTFNYDAAKNMLSFEYNDSTLYVFVMTATDGAELRVSDDDGAFGSSVYCVKSDKIDAYRNKYTDKDGNYLVLDGFSRSTYANGYAAVYDKEDELTDSFVYRVNEFGAIELCKRIYNEENELVKVIYFVLIPAKATDEGAFANGSAAYVIVTPDRYYMVKAKDYFGGVYTFDGLGTVKKNDGTVYSYTVAEQTENDELNLICRMTFTDAENEKHAVSFDYSTTDYAVAFTDELTGVTVTETQTNEQTGNVTKETTYRFVCRGAMEVTVTDYDRNGNALNSAVKVYTYTVADVSGDKKVYKLSLDSDGIKYTAELTLGDGGNAIKLERA